VAGPLSPGPEVPGSPAAQVPGPEAAAFFGGTGGVKILESGEESIVDGVEYLRGQVSQMLPRLIEVDDPRVGGAQTFTQHAADYGGFGPTWGTFRIEDDAGAWVGDVSGAWSGNGTWFSGWLTGEGAYEGLVQFYQAEGGVANIRFSGVIYPALSSSTRPRVGWPTSGSAASSTPQTRRRSSWKRLRLSSAVRVRDRRGSKS